MAKRSCRRTVDENKIHEQAVKIRKMTDIQLVKHIEDKTETAKKEGYQEGYKEGIKSMPSTAEPIDIDNIIDEIGRVKGIGEGKLKDIRRIISKSLKGNENERMAYSK